MELDYKKIGLKSGLEIHQQLDTGKLFCKCPSYLRSEVPHFIIKREMHPVAGETGEIDDAVKHESLLKRKFEYEGYSDTTCLVELDEEPPHVINEQALEEALKIALLLNCEIYPYTQIMRKIVIDGSNTSGFQRTLLLAHDGYIETSFGKIGIDSLYLEEDSARIISKDNSKTIYRLDRLGIPLVEITTKAELDTPEKIKETALKIGEILRACKVKRGIGTIRQDLNISIKGHAKVEIKGFQEPRIMIETVVKEIKRQFGELKNENPGKPEVRNSLSDGSTEFLRPAPGKARMYPETDLPILKISRDKINSLKKILPKLKTEISSELQKKGLSNELINLILDKNLDEFETLLNVYNKDANLVAKMVTIWRNEIATKSKKSLDEIKKTLDERTLEKILEHVRDKKIEPSDVKPTMEKLAQEIPFEETVKIEKISHDSLEEEIAKIVREKPGLKPNAYMGLVMARFKGKIDAKKAMEIINKLTKH